MKHVYIGAGHIYLLSKREKFKKYMLLYESG